MEERWLKGTEVWNRWSVSNPGVVVDLTGENPGWADLTNLRETHLRMADLHRAELNWANLSAANLTGRLLRDLSQSEKT